METETIETVPFEQRVDRLATHLLRAGKGNKAAILFAVYISEFARADAEKLLEKRLQEAGETIVRVRVQPEGETVDLPLYLRNHPRKGKAVFFIYDLTRGGDATEQYLNYRREFLVEDQQRLLLWLHEKEIGQLARNAPDFWAFRGRTLEFLEQPTPQRKAELVGDLAYYNWHGDNSQSKKELEAGIHLREHLLDELPKKPSFSKNRADLLYTLATQYEMVGNPEKALELINEAEKFADPTNIRQLSSIYSGRGNIFQSLNQYEEALADYEEALRLDPEDSMTYSNRGIVFLHQREYEAALADYRKAIQLNPEYAKAFFNRGNTYLDLERYVEALADFGEAIRLNPEYAKAFYNRGNTYLALERNKEALADFGEAIRLNPKHAKAFYNRGHTYQAQGAYAAASADYEEAIRLNLESTHLHLNLAVLKMTIDKSEEALQHLQQGLKIDPNERQRVAESSAFAPLRDDPRFRALVGLDAEDEQA
ncbi:hypothetical protein MNBD_CHLOROFLEXI01-176 [hydrothermal vent metagenome]|uniref:Uncharacterized protein n=1 Tax=hydrothermal vent metagenome TaxID=652676 RepID=A0A3B0UQE4_9ZZZZ